MRFCVRLAVILAVLTCGSVIAHASDPMGVYAIIDKVVLEPNADKPERIQVSGVFMIAKEQHGDNYEGPQRGYFYFKLGNRPDQALKEWNDLKSVAGKHGVVGFGSRYAAKGSVRSSDVKPENPDSYQLSMGVIRVRSDTDYGPVKALLEADHR
jgi:hypothetical protein